MKGARINPLTISIDREADFAARDSYVLSHPRGLGYQLSAFGKAVGQAYGFETLYLTARNGRRISGILALTALSISGKSIALVSAPYCDAAGILGDSPAVEKALLDAGLWLARKRGIPRVSLRNSSAVAGIDPKITRHPGKVRLVLTLPDDPASLLAGLKAKVRSQVKKPVRDGLRFSLGGRELLQPFFSVFSENMRDLGSPVHSIDWIDEILRAYGNRAHIGLVRTPGGKPAAVGLILCHPVTVSIPLASSVRRYNRMNPNMLLYWKFLEFACRNRFQRFDFGRSTPGEGTYRFKAQWGATPEDLHWADFDPFASNPAVPLSPNRPAGLSPVRKAAEQTLSRTPLALATFIGRCVRKYIPL